MIRQNPSRALKYLVVLGCLAASAARLAAQPASATMIDFSAGSQYEEYLRALQDAGISPLYPWSIRAFSRPEITRLTAADSTGPWRLDTRLGSGAIEAGPVTLRAIGNTSYPYGSNDGALWVGKGLTLAADGGVSGHLGPLSYAVAPIAFWAQNASFALLSNHQTGSQQYNSGNFPASVDLPQRFGNSSYSRLDPGQSYLRFDSHFLTAGVSSANEWIGPASEHPFLLGNNAPGFPHLFLGTGEPLNVWVGHVHARAMWGKLYQSAYSPVGGGPRYTSLSQTGTERLTASANFVFIPRGVPGLELGVARFFHIPNTESEPNSKFWRKPFEVLFLKNELAAGDTAGADNQLASLFFRWVFPHSGLEIYGERGFEDQFYDLRELLQDIDHEREYMIGFAKVFHRTPASFDVIKTEVANYQLPTLARVRKEEKVYVHTILRQGHTNRGQLLGISAGVGAAAASTVSWNRYSQSGRTTVTLRRIVRSEAGNFEFTGIENRNSSDVLVAAGLERMRFGAKMDIGARVEAMDNFNRNFASDVTNLNVQLIARLHR